MDRMQNHNYIILYIQKKMNKFKKFVLVLLALIILCIISLESAHMTVQSGRCLCSIFFDDWMRNDVVPFYINFKTTLADWLWFTK